MTILVTVFLVLVNIFNRKDIYPAVFTTIVYSLKSGNRFREPDGKPRDRQIEGKKSKRGERGSYKASARRTS